MSDNKDNMTKSRWDYIKTLRMSRGRCIRGSGTSGTFNEGRNAAKRARRASKGVRK